MRAYPNLYIDGEWRAPAASGSRVLIDPASETPSARVAEGSIEDVDLAVSAARAAFASFSRFSRAERIELLQRIATAYRRRQADMAEAISLEMGAPLSLAAKAHVAVGASHLAHMIKVINEFKFVRSRGTTVVLREPIGVCGLITPWNWPMNQIMCKVAPALAAGCTMVLKPSEIAPLSAIVLAEMIDEAGVPAGVFNLVTGEGARVGHAIAAHDDVDMVSFTGTTQVGIEIAEAAARTVKRVHQELGGKSANIILPDADLASAVTQGVFAVMRNSGQSCNAPTRMLVAADQHERAAAIAARAAQSLKIGPPRAADTDLGPVASEARYHRVQELIESGIAEGARLVAGGLGRPEGLDRGFYVRPTIFAGVDNQMTIARQEIFGPVLSILPYRTEEDAIRIANDSAYGLAAYIQTGSAARARRVAVQLRAGSVHINGAQPDLTAPFGGYRRSGNGREYGEWGLLEFLELKSVMGVEQPRAAGA